MGGGVNCILVCIFIFRIDISSYLLQKRLIIDMGSILCSILESMRESGEAASSSATFGA